MYFKERDTASPVGQRAPERGAQEFDERPEADEKAALTRVHAHLLEIHPHEWEQGAEGRVEEEVEGLHGEEFLVDGAEEILQDVALTANLVRGLLRLGVHSGIDLTLGLRVHHRPGPRHLGENSARLGRVIRHAVVVILVSIVLHDSQLAFARSTETLARPSVYFPSDWMEPLAQPLVTFVQRTERAAGIRSPSSSRSSFRRTSADWTHRFISTVKPVLGSPSRSNRCRAVWGSFASKINKHPTAPA